MKRTAKTDADHRIDQYLAELSAQLKGSPEEREVLAAVRTHFAQRLGPDSTVDDVNAAIVELGPPSALAGSTEAPAGRSSGQFGPGAALAFSLIAAVLLVLLPPAGALLSIVALVLDVTLLVRRPDMRGDAKLGAATVVAALCVAATVYWFVLLRGASDETVLHDPVPSQVP